MRWAVKLTTFSIALCWSAWPQGCSDWREALLASFLPQKPDVAWLSRVLEQSPEQWRSWRAQQEIRVLGESGLARTLDHPAIPALRARLRRFYEAGAELYGLRLDPEKVFVSADRSVNAFATGSHIVVHQGLLAYYGDPVGYLKSVSPMLLLARRLDEVRAIFSWQRDGPSLDFILAHEAAHNLMAHTDERFVEALGRQLEELASDARARRQALANGKGGPGVRHYLGTALARFLSHFPAAQYNVAQEEEADAVAAALLARAGSDPRNGLAALERLYLLQGGPRRTSWSSTLSSLLCATHPDPPRRLAALERSVTCLHLSGRLCEEHITYPLEKRLGELRQRWAAINAYDEETVGCWEGSRKPEGCTQAVEIRPDPRDARILIDGTAVPAGELTLPCGRHVLTAAREGYRGTRIVFGVFPDVKSTLKFKLKKCGGREPCPSALEDFEPGPADP